MKALFIALVAATGLAGCTYEAPLSTSPIGRISEELIGLWEEVPDSPGEKGGLLSVVPFDDGNLLAVFPVGDDELYFRAWPVKVAGVSAIQLQIVGAAKPEPTPEPSGKNFSVVVYEFDGDDLILKSLNEDLVPPSLTTTAEIVEAFTEHAGDPDLFNNPDRYRRVKRSGSD